MHTTKSSGLLKDEQDLKKNFTNRAAACFPLFDLYKTDLKLVFQNYWKWKRGINILYNATIRNKNGVTLFNLGLTKPLNQNMLSCKKIINENNINYKEVKYGTIELEIISTKNIVYPFPAILAYYESISGFVSVVHSAGRTLEESTQNYENFNETNFYASSEKEYKPFIHIFNGPEGFLKDLQVNIRSFNHDFNSRKFELDFVIKPYQSKLLFLDKFIEIYKSELIKDNKFLSKEILRNIEFGISLSGSSKSIYPRFICGNYDLVNDHPYVTHTFRKILDEKDSVKVTNHHCSSTIALPRTADMNIKALIFPTTSPSRKELKASFYDLDKKEIFKQFDNVDISNDGNCFYIDDENYDDNIKNIGLEVSPSLNSTNDEIPARIPVSLRYSLSQGNKSLHTDIATQLRTAFSGEKTNFWFQGYFKKNIKHLIFISQLLPGIIQSGFKSNKSLKFIFYLQLSDQDNRKLNFSFDMKELSVTLNLIDIAKELFPEIILNEDTLYSWRIELKEGSIQDIYCVSLDKKNGIIFADHSF